MAGDLAADRKATTGMQSHNGGCVEAADGRVIATWSIAKARRVPLSQGTTGCTGCL